MEHTTPRRSTHGHTTEHTHDGEHPAECAPVEHTHTVSAKAPPLIEPAGGTLVDATATRKRPRRPNHHAPDASSPPSEFHPINLAFPGLRTLHHAPDVWAVDGFLKSSECARLLGKAARAKLRHSVQTDYATGATYVSEDRTSTYCIISQREVPSLVARLEALCGLPASHFERLKLVRYAAGERFAPHWDGFEGARNSSGFVDSSRVVTVFAYLTSIPPGGGGETKFPRLGLSIRPVRGTAVVHLPGRLDCSRDDRCEHEGAAAGARAKWVLVCQGWMHPKCEATVGVREADTRRLSRDSI